MQAIEYIRTQDISSSNAAATSPNIEANVVKSVAKEPTTKMSPLHITDTIFMYQFLVTTYYGSGNYTDGIDICSKILLLDSANFRALLKRAVGYKQLVSNLLLFRPVGV